jgi:hypothetical protein
MLENKVILYFLVYLSVGELVNSKTAQIWKLNPEEAKIIFSTNIKVSARASQPCSEMLAMDENVIIFPGLFLCFEPLGRGRRPNIQDNHVHGDQS